MGASLRFDHFVEAKTLQDKTFVWSQDGEVALMDPSKREPEYLMTPAQPHYRKYPPPGQKAVPEMASWASQAPWDAPEERALKSNGNRSSSIGMHGDDFFALLSPMTTTESYDLMVYSKTTGRKPRHIPLQFHLDTATHAALALIYDDKTKAAPE